jgi:hypothetical protein
MKKKEVQNKIRFNIQFSVRIPRKKKNIVRTDSVPRGDGYLQAGRRWCSMNSDSDQDHDAGCIDGDGDYPRGW